MKEIITPVRYEAADGATFSKKEHCEEYEAVLKALEEYSSRHSIPQGRLIICWEGETYKKYRG